MNCGECLMDHAEVIPLETDGSCKCCALGHKTVNFYVEKQSDGWAWGTMDGKKLSDSRYHTAESARRAAYAAGYIFEEPDSDFATA